jgi:hypothetical protein
MSDTTAADFLKFASALILVCEGEFRMNLGSEPVAEAALGRLRHLHSELLDATGRFCPEGVNSEAWLGRYSDGRRVVSAMPMGGGCYVHAWHPDPSVNRPCELDVVTTPDGSRKRVIVVAEGFLDAVSVDDQTVFDWST